VGTWQRNPHARWTTTLQDVKELAAIQKQLLAHAAPSVKRGGKLIFAVCTLTRSETTEVVADFSAKFSSDFEPLVQDGFDAAKFIWPHDLNGNGMFIAGWRRKKA
jgi:16S rRNA (cytosine967-C5)-methyltransferase